MNSDQPQTPFKTLGDRLKAVRQKLHESVVEVSGAVEIEEQTLQRIEEGHERPTEDILMLLINHFGIQDDDAANLWQLAGYDQPREHDHNHADRETTPNNRSMIMIMAVDPRIIYSDGAQVTANSQGVVISFSQAAGTPHALTTSRIGMSREQAYGLMHTLEKTLEGSKPRQIPASTSDNAPKTNRRRTSDDQSKK